MGTRGRKSAAELAVIGPGGVATVRRPEPPGELTGEQADEWRAIVNRLPADWFPRETHCVLAQLCRHITRARRWAQVLDDMERGEALDMKEYDAANRAEAKQSEAIARLTTKLRITQQATVDYRKTKGSVRQRPWEVES